MLYNVEKFTFKDLSVRRIKADGINWVCVLDLCKGLQVSRSSTNVRNVLKGEKTRRFSIPVPVSGLFLKQRDDISPVIDAYKRRVEDRGEIVEARKTRVENNGDSSSVVDAAKSRTEDRGKRTALRELVFTDESGVYTMILRSDKPEAQEFRHWVTSEVLPSIREVGSYTIPQLREQQQTDEGKQLTLFEEKAKTLTEQKISFEVFVKVEGGASTCITTTLPAGSDIQKVFATWGNINEAVTNILPAKQ